MKPSKLRGGGIMALGVGFLVGALILVVGLINASAYLLGAGEVVRVTVTESSEDSGESETSGTGYYEADGERVAVRLYDVWAGETIVTRLPLVPLDFGGGPTLVTDKSIAWEDVITKFLGTLALSGFGVVMVVGGWNRATKVLPPRHRTRKVNRGT